MCAAANQVAGVTRNMNAPCRPDGISVPQKRCLHTARPARLLSSGRLHADYDLRWRRRFRAALPSELTMSPSVLVGFGPSHQGWTFWASGSLNFSAVCGAEAPPRRRGIPMWPQASSRPVKLCLVSDAGDLPVPVQLLLRQGRCAGPQPPHRQANKFRGARSQRFFQFCRSTRCSYSKSSRGTCPSQDDCWWLSGRSGCPSAPCDLIFLKWA
jgi:hypothetical protein